MNRSAYPDPDFVPHYPWLGNPENGRLYQEARNYGEREKSDELNPPLGLPQNSSSDEDYESSRAVSLEDESELDLIDSDDYEAQGDDAEQPQADGKHGAELFATSRPRGRPRGKGRVSKGTKRGLVRPLEPDLEFKQALALANEAFIGRRLDEAQEHVLEAIRLNPEIFQAHVLLSEIYAALGDDDASVRALFNGAHTRSRDFNVWSTVRDKLLASAGDRGVVQSCEGILYCLGRMLILQPENLEIRNERISHNIEAGHYVKAYRDLEILLQNRPNDLVLLRQYAEVSMQTGDIENAIDEYEKAIGFYQRNDNAPADTLDWSDINVFVELCAANKEYYTAIDSLKSLSRWMLGRSSDLIWSDINDDREWDLEDERRRIGTPGFVPGIFEKECYGEGLPLELRVKLGLYRLKLDPSSQSEALSHFEWLEPENDDDGAKVGDYPDLFRDVGEALLSHTLYTEALRYYGPLQRLEGFLDAAILENMATCYRFLDRRVDAESCYVKMIELGDRVTIAREQLMSMGEEDGSTVRIQLLLQDLAIGFSAKRRLLENAEPLLGGGAETIAAGLGVLKPSLRKEHLEKAESRLREVRQEEYQEEMQRKFIHLQSLTENVRQEAPECRTRWLVLADELIQDFASYKPFYPTDKYYMSSVLIGRVHASPLEQSIGGKDIPTLYHGIAYSSWLDLILETSIFRAQRGQTEKAYETVMVALDAVVFAISAPSLLLIHVCWFTCAIIANDHETLCNVARWFMREYQFVSDGYRLFGALNRVCAYENSWYNSGPSQKHILRQLKAMDNSLRRKADSYSSMKDVASFSTKDEDGNPILAGEVNIALLMLYGHILYAGKSYAEALNYYFRAYSTETENPTLNFSIGLAYLHHAFKRQSDNRHHLVLQGFSFLYKYYDARIASPSPSLRQEAEYNMGRAYHTIGLTHLASPFYESCLTDSQVSGTDQNTKDFSKEAAMALQTLTAASNNRQKAKAITERWLLI